MPCHGTRSATNEEAQLRQRVVLMLSFIEKARAVQPKGQVVLVPAAQASQTIPEDGDVIRVPNRNNTVLVSGEWCSRPPSSGGQLNRADFHRRAGGFADCQRGPHRDRASGTAAWRSPSPHRSSPATIMVPPKITTKSIEITRAITTIPVPDRLHREDPVFGV